MIDQIQNVTDQLQAELDQIAAERGATVVSFNVLLGHSRFNVGAYEMVLALLQAGFHWHHDNVWRVVVGLNEMDMTGASDAE